MRFAFVSSDVGVPEWASAGASVRVYELSRALERLGHEATVLMPDAGGGAWEQLREFEPDLVYERYSLLGAEGLALARLLGVPFVAEIHTRPADERMPRRGLERPDAADALEEFLIRSADAVVAASERVGRRLAARGVDPARIAVVQNAVDAAAFARPRLARDPGQGKLPTIGVVAALTPRRDVDTVIRAAAILHRTGRPVGLVLVGEGPERERLEQLARDEHVSLATEFKGPLAHESIPTQLAECDVAVVPYREGSSPETRPLALFEWLAAGRPVIGADFVEIRRCIQPCETGLVYMPGDARNLAEAMGLLLHDPAFAASLGRAGREHVLAYHTWEGEARALVELAVSLGVQPPTHGRRLLISLRRPRAREILSRCAVPRTSPT